MQAGGSVAVIQRWWPTSDGGVSVCWCVGSLRSSCSGLEINDGLLCETTKQVRHQSSQSRLDRRFTSYYCRAVVLVLQLDTG